MLHRIGIVFFFLPACLAAQTTPTTPKSSDNPELTQLFREDQRVRQPKPFGPDEQKITRSDADRLALVKQVIAHDQVHSTADCLHAALILQHSLISTDYLVAHTLAVICAADGDKTCLWLSAATLDRYLQSIQQPQIYGTQFLSFDHPPITQQPYASDLISDSLRAKLGISSVDVQKKRLDQLNNRPTTPAVTVPQNKP
jgi:hypothetical protein